MKTYGQTACPEYGCLNNMYRSLAVCKHIPSWDKVTCYACGNRYKHSDKFNNLKKESEQQLGRD